MWRGIWGERIVMAPGQARTGPGSRVRLSGHDTTHETRTYVQTWTRRPQEGKKNVAVMAKELKNNFVIKGFLAHLPSSTWWRLPQRRKKKIGFDFDRALNLAWLQFYSTKLGGLGRESRHGPSRGSGSSLLGWQATRGPGSPGQGAEARCSVGSSGRRSTITRGCTPARVEATVQVYTVHSDRLLFSVRASTVRKLRSLYGEPGADTGRGLHPALRVQRHHNYLLHSSLDDLNQHGPS